MRKQCLRLLCRFRIAALGPPPVVGDDAEGPPQPRAAGGGGAGGALGGDFGPAGHVSIEAILAGERDAALAMLGRDSAGLDQGQLEGRWRGLTQGERKKALPVKLVFGFVSVVL